jgi:hypothetical protein
MAVGYERQCCRWQCCMVGVYWEGWLWTECGSNMALSGEGGGALQAQAVQWSELHRGCIAVATAVFSSL